MAATVQITCEEDECENFGKLINSIKMPEEEAQTFLEGFGHGGEDQADYCPKCGKLGIAELF